MNWDAIGAMGQTVSALALVFVLVQVWQARMGSRRALSQGRAEAIRAVVAMRMDAETLRVATKAEAALGGPMHPFALALMDQAGLTLEEASRLTWMQVATWDCRLQMISNVDELPPMERYAFDGGIRALYGRLAGIDRLFYETYIKPGAHPEAVRYVENLLAPPG